MALVGSPQLAIEWDEPAPEVPMSVRPKFAPADQMTIEEFLAFTDTRPDEERWELIEGVPVLNASPIDFHQIIAANITTALMNHKVATGATWLPLLGIGTRVPVSTNSLPQPDVFVLEGAPKGTPVTDDALVIFEILSRSNSKADQAWRRRVYASVPNCQHYVTVSLKTGEATAYDRATAWKARTVKGLAAALELAAISVTLPLSDVYRYTPIGQP
jgi:Uma2 family endonuclease